MEEVRIITLKQSVFADNDADADRLRQQLKEEKTFLVNLMSSPGAGKTSTIISLIDRLRDKYRIGVIEGDIAGQIDADTIHALGIPVVQLDTDGACHIEAMSIQLLLKEFDLANLDVIFVENIGNLVCPAEFNIGESFRLALLSIPEGDDKVEKYPLMFATSHALAMNKYDLKEYFGFDDERVERSARGINPEIQIFRVSSRDGLGLDELTGWISRRIDDTIAKS